MTTSVASRSHRATTPVRPSRPRSVAGWVARVLAWMVILATIGVLALAVLVPRLGSATPYAILTGSMQPGLPPGTLVVMKPVSANDIHPGMVITYQLESGEPTVVTHRVVDQRTTLGGVTEWQTKGDANGVADERWVRDYQVRGTLWYAVPQLGRANTVLNGPEHQLLVYGTAALLAIYAGAMFAGAAWTRGRARPEESES